jgi:hypothetical protein
MKPFIRRLRTNENVLIAIEALLHGRAAFTGVFLVTFMVSLSVDDSPAQYLIYRLAASFLLAVMAQLLVRPIRRYPLIAWRLGMVAVCLQIIAIVTLYEYTAIYPYIVAFFTAVEATLFWRPHVILSVTEVSNDRRLRFESLKVFWGVLVKIIMPVVLGLIIVETNFVDASVVVLALSVVQLFVSLLFRPTVKLPRRSGCKNVLQTIKKYRGKGIFSKLAMAQSRGFFTSDAAYVVVPILLIHSLDSSDFDLGLYTSLGAVVAVVYIWLYKSSLRHPRFRYGLLVFSSFSLVAAPLVCIIFPTLIFAVLFYLITHVVGGMFNTLAIVSFEDVLKKVRDEDKFEVEAVSENLLAIGRVVTLSGLLIIVLLGGDMRLILLYCSVTALVSLLFVNWRTVKL